MIKQIITYCFLMVGLTILSLKLVQAQDFVDSLAIEENIYEFEPKSDYIKEDLVIYEYDKSKWDRIVKDIDYSEDISDDDDKPNDYNRNFPSPSFDAGFITGFLKFLAFLAAAILIGIVIFHLMGVKNLIRPKNKKFVPDVNDENIDIESIEEHIHESDLDGFIRKAVGQENYTLAIRLYYLAIIKELSVNNQIIWKKDKTNRDYINELKQSNLQIPFKEITNIFERIWYGNKIISASDFEQVKPKFQSFIKSANIQIN